ncbi:hypothetical protein LY76DRAFT_160813 [Colletotrichum caudatum]|nr:hypothetical protein LY76DRAFT_160813 [Colletotrichum caudatum]
MPLCASASCVSQSYSVQIYMVSYLPTTPSRHMTLLRDSFRFFSRHSWRRHMLLPLPCIQHLYIDTPLLPFLFSSGVLPPVAYYYYPPSCRVS